MVDPASAALRGACTFAGETLPDPLPSSPWGLFMEWLGDAQMRRTQPNPNAFALATVDADGQPSARIVLARGVDAESGHISFFTNYHSRKGDALSAHPRAAACFHWDHLERQVRIEGPVTKAPEAASDAYFRSRPVLSRIAAWASDQSEAIHSRAALLEKNAQAEARFGYRPGMSQRELDGLEVPRPPHWGGYHLWAQRVELWLGHSARLHDRAAYMRSLAPTGDRDRPFAPGPWTLTRLQP